MKGKIGILVLAIMAVMIFSSTPSFAESLTEDELIGVWVEESGSETWEFSSYELKRVGWGYTTQYNYEIVEAEEMTMLCINATEYETQYPSAYLYEIIYSEGELILKLALKFRYSFASSYYFTDYVDFDEDEKIITLSKSE